MRANVLSRMLVLAATLVVAPLASAVIPAPPPLENKAYVLVDYQSGQVLARSNEHQRLAPASLTKMMTSYIIEQRLKSSQLKPTDMVSVSEYAWCRGTSAESCMYVPLHGQASVMDMLRGIIIQSGNDASKAMAEHIAGTEPAFAELMNAEAKRLGMNDSHFMNATGLPDPAHYTSAFDMAILARAIIRDSAEHYPIYKEKEFTFNSIKQGNRNALLYTDPSVDGLKTGHTDEAGYCLVASSQRGDMRLISAVMGTTSMQARADQTRALFNWGYSFFETVKPFTASKVIATSPVWFGQADSVQLGLAQDLAVTLPRGDSARLKAVTQLNPEVRAPFKKGQPLGKLVLSLDGKALSTAPLVAMQDVDEANFFVRLWHHIKLFFSKLF